MATPTLPRLTPSEKKILSQRGYKLVKKLGEGAYARVYLSVYTPQVNPQKTSKLACKILDVNKAPKDFVQKFVPREMDILVKLNHPHVVHAHSVFQRRSKYYIFMRFAEKGDLYTIIENVGPLSEQQSRIWFKQITLGLEYLHLQDIAHRDIKGENVLITANNNALLSDFGFARYVVDDEGEDILSETFCGTMSFVAPEIIRGLLYDCKKADMWSLGVLLYSMLTQRMPFDSTDVDRLLVRQLAQRWAFRPQIDKVLTRECKIVVRGLMQPSPEQRVTCDELFGSAWFEADPRGNKLTPQEEHARICAISAGQELRLGKKPAGAIKKRSRIPVRVQQQKVAEPEPGIKVIKEAPARMEAYTSTPMLKKKK